MCLFYVDRILSLSDETIFGDVRLVLIIVSVYTAVVSFTNPPIMSGPGPENNGPPPLSLGPEVQFCWLPALTLEPSVDMLLFPLYPLP